MGRSRIKKGFILGLIAVSTSVAPLTTFADTQTDLQSRRDEMGILSDKIIQNTLDKEELEKNISKNNTEIDKLTKEVKLKEENIGKRKDDLAKNMRATQVDSKNDNFINILLNSESLTDATNRLFVKKTIVDAKDSKINSVKEDKTELENKVSELNKRKDTLNKDKEKLNTVTEELKEQESNLTEQIQGLETKYSSELAKEQQANEKVQKAQQKVMDLPTGKAVDSPKETGVQSNVVATASQYIGVPYVFGGSTPSGFDCSGLTSYVFGQHGISLGRTAGAQSLQGVDVPLSNLQAGDLVFWGSVGGAYHVGIYAGNGSYIHSPVPGESVTYQSMSAWSPNFAKRVL